MEPKQITLIAIMELMLEWEKRLIKAGIVDNSICQGLSLRLFPDGSGSVLADWSDVKWLSEQDQKLVRTVMTMAPTSILHLLGHKPAVQREEDGRGRGYWRGVLGMIITSPYVPDPEGYEGWRSFGLTIRGRRMGAGMIHRCAEAMGISMADLSAIEQGRIAMATEQRERAARPMLGDTEPRRLTDDELGGRAALEAAGLEPVDGWDDERSE